MKDNLVSIIVPIYNVEKFLNRCVESLINQTYKNLEILLIDDGSPDNSPKMCDEWAAKDKRIKVVHKKNGGVSSARNTGIDKASGQYVCFVDADDTIELSFVEKLLNKQIETNSDIVFCKYRRVNQNFEEIKVKEDKIDLFVKDPTIESFFNLDIWIIWRALYKAQLIKKVKMNEKFGFGEDTQFFYELLLQKPKISYIEDVLYNYFYNSGSITSVVTQEKAKSHYQSLNKRIEFFNNLGYFELADCTKFYIYILAKTYYYNVSKTSSEIKAFNTAKNYNAYNKHTFLKEKRIIAFLVRYKMSWVVKLLRKIKKKRK